MLLLYVRTGRGVGRLATTARLQETEGESRNFNRLAGQSIDDRKL